MTEEKKRLLVGLSAVFLAAVFSVVFLLMNSGGLDRRVGIDREATASVDGVRLITVRNGHGAIRVLPGNTAKITARLHGRHTDRDLKLRVREGAGTVRISVDQRSWITLMQFGSVDLDVTVPKGYRGSLESDNSAGSTEIGLRRLDGLSAESSAGPMTIHGLSAREINLKNSAGNIETEDLSCSGDIRIRNSAGSILTGVLKCDNLRLDSSAGRIEVLGIEAQKAEVNNSASSTRLTGLKDTDLKGHSSAGGFHAEYVTFRNDVDIRNSGGGITIKLPAASSFNIDADTSAGNVSCDFPVTSEDSGNDHLKGEVGGNPGSKDVRLRSSAGDISIEK